MSELPLFFSAAKKARAPEAVIGIRAMRAEWKEGSTPFGATDAPNVVQDDNLIL
jgi:hypothetical protein